MLEVGCGTSPLGSWFIDNCKEYTGIDLSPKSIEKAKEDNGESYKFLVGDFLEHEFEDTYDLVYFPDSLEHIIDWKAAIKKSAGLLDQRGMLMINLPLAEFTRFFFRFAYREQIIDNEIWMPELLEEFHKNYLQLFFYQMYGVECIRQYQFIVAIK